MKKQPVLFSAALVAVFALGTVAGVFAAADKGVSPVPTLLDPAVFEGKGLETVPPWPAEIVLSGESKSTSATLFMGEFVAIVYESSAVKLALTDYPFDEFVHVQNGNLVLTPDGGEAQTFEKGDSLVVPKGFTGTWEMSDGYREFLIVEAKAMQAAMQPGGLLEIYSESE